MRNIDSFSSVILTLKTYPRGSREFEYAFREYFKIVNRKILKYAEQLCYSSSFTIDEEDVKELVQISFIKLSKRISSLHEIKDGEDESAYKTKIVGYQRVILRNCFIDLTKSKGFKERTAFVEEMMSDYDVESIEGNFLNFIEEDVSLNVKIVRNFLNTLSERERLIILTYAEFNAFNGRELPEYVRSKLCEELNISKSYLRVLKKRAFDKIKDYLLTLLSEQNNI